MPGSRIAIWLADRIDRHRYVILAALSAAFFYSAASRAAAKPFWHDEIYTILLTGLPSIAAVWTAMKDGVDLSPPLNAVLTRAVRAVAGVNPISIRLVPMISVWLTMVILFAIVRRRASALVALTAALFPFLTAAYRHSYEARAYGLMMLLFTLVLFAWTEAAAGRARVRNLVLLALALAAGVWNHYYAVLAYLPVAAGEVVRTFQLRKLDVGVASAVGVSILLALPVVALLGAASSQSSTFWSPASASQLTESYMFLLQPVLNGGFLVAVILVASIGLIGHLLRIRNVDAGLSVVPAPELAAIVTAVLVPAAGVVLGLLVTGVFVPRYALPGVAGASIAIAYAIAYASRHARVAELVMPAMLASSLWPLLRPVGPSPQPFDSRPVLVASLQEPGVTAITGGLTFLQLWYYAPAHLKPRLVYVADPDAARQLTGSDTFDLGMLALSRWTTVAAVPLDTFLERHERFRVYAYGSGWLMEALKARGAHFAEAGTDASATLYGVKLNHPRNPQSAIPNRQ